MRKILLRSSIIGLTFQLYACHAQEKIYQIPVAGNAFEIGNNSDKTSVGKNTITLNAENFNPTNIYFKLLNKGELNIKLKLNNNNNNKLYFNFLETEKEININAKSNLVDLGKFKIKSEGYHSISLKSLQGQFEISEVILGGSSTSNGVIYSNDPSYFYWARRGPSCHLSYTIPTDKNVSYYYNEIKVPKNHDVIGSYFMANGFGEGYFGMQVNSENERRILFSVWSPFVTDDPKSIPDDEKIKLLRKGKDVYTGEFGNEGSGGQSYLKYNWKADTTYKFLLKGTPNGDNSTTYTAWFADSNSNKWNLIASFNRPKTNTYLKRFHSFLENFIPNQGYITRQVNFNNQWVYDGEWKKVNEGKLTVDATYRANQRVDATGGLTITGYYLKMGGFFDEIAEPNSVFKFNNQQQKPSIDFSQLP